MTFVIIGGGIDLSVGSLLALSAVLAAYGSQYGQRRGRGAAPGRVRAHRPVQRAAHRASPDGRLHRDARRPAVRPRPRLRRVRRGQHDLPPRQPARRHLAGPGLDRGDPGPDHHRRGRVPRRLGGPHADPLRHGRDRDRRQRGRGPTHGPAHRPGQDRDVPHERPPRGPRGPAGRGSLVVGPVDDRGRARAAGDRRRRDRRDAADRGLGVDDGHARRRAPAQRHQQRDQPGRDAQLLLPAGGERRCS